jgi:hypothetical protein
MQAMTYRLLCELYRQVRLSLRGDFTLQQILEFRQDPGLFQLHAASNSLSITMATARVGLEGKAKADEQPSHNAIDNGNPAHFKPRWFVLVGTAACDSFGSCTSVGCLCSRTATYT